MKIYSISILLLIVSVQAMAQSVDQGSNMKFGDVVQGDSAKIVLPGTSNNATNAHFKVKGPTKTTFSIVVDKTATLYHKRKPANTIPLYDISTYPVDEGVTNKKGVAKVYVGGTLGAIQMNQKTGNYRGDFTLEVIF